MLLLSSCPTKIFMDNRDTPTHWQGQLQMAPDFVLIQGDVGATSAHAHFAHQFLWAPGQRLQVSLDGVAYSSERFFIPALQAHEVLAAAENVFTVFAEPTEFPSARLQKELASAEPSLAGLATALHQARQTAALDTRLLSALAALDASLTENKINAQELARHASLSLSQLERLFGQQIGMPVRRLVLWRRLRLALVLALSGETLTDAAHGAGFADAAHFSRTMRQMFGVRADQTLRGFHIEVIA